MKTVNNIQPFFKTEFSKYSLKSDSEIKIVVAAKKAVKKKNIIFATPKGKIANGTYNINEKGEYLKKPELKPWDTP